MENILTYIKEALEKEDVSMDSILDRLGLQQRRSVASLVLPIIGAFVGGALIGSGITFLVAPKSGAQLREDIKSGVDDVRERLMRPGQDPGDVHA